jgi:hypothetical protein
MEPGDDINEILGNVASKETTDTFSDTFKTNKKSGKNKLNEKTNKVAVNAFNYENETDTTYGGYQNQPNSK